MTQVRISRSDLSGSQEPTVVRMEYPFGSYHGRIGPDGTKGYILQGDVGFRVETEKGKKYVVTIPDPEDLVEYVKAAMAHRASR